MGKPKVDHAAIFDSSNRMFLLGQLLEMTGLSNDDHYLVAFSMMGNTPVKDASLPDVLKKVYLPKADLKGYDREQLLKWIEMLKKQLKEFDNYGIFDMDKQEIKRFAKNHKYLTIYGLNVNPVVYRSVIEILEKHPDYALSVFFGIAQFFDALRKFLKVETE